MRNSTSSCEMPSTTPNAALRAYLHNESTYRNLHNRVKVLQTKYRHTLNLLKSKQHYTDKTINARQLITGLKEYIDNNKRHSQYIQSKKCKYNWYQKQLRRQTLDNVLKYFKYRKVGTRYYVQIMSAYNEGMIDARRKEEIEKNRYKRGKVLEQGYMSRLKNKENLERKIREVLQNNRSEIDKLSERSIKIYVYNNMRSQLYDLEAKIVSIGKPYNLRWSNASSSIKHPQCEYYGPLIKRIDSMLTKYARLF